MDAIPRDSEGEVFVVWSRLKNIRGRLTKVPIIRAGDGEHVGPFMIVREPHGMQGTDWDTDADEIVAVEDGFMILRYKSDVHS